MEWLECIKKIKKDKKLTNERLSELSGISLGTLNKLLSGATTDPKLSTLTALSNAFSCSMDALLGTASYGDISSLPDIERKYYELAASGQETDAYILNKE